MDKNFALAAVRLAVSAAVLVLAALQLLKVWDRAVSLMEPLLGVLLLIQGIQMWKSSRKTAVFSLCVSAFVFLTSIYILVG